MDVLAAVCAVMCGTQFCQHFRVIIEVARGGIVELGQVWSCDATVVITPTKLDLSHSLVAVSMCYKLTCHH